MDQIAKNYVHYLSKSSLQRPSYHIYNNNLELTIMLQKICSKNYRYALLIQVDVPLQSFLNYSFIKINLLLVY